MPHNTSELALLNFSYISLEILRHRELLDWGLTVAGSVTLLLYNLIRIGRMLRNPQPKSEQPKKKRLRKS
jgi:hypothetical protein